MLKKSAVSSEAGVPRRRSRRQTEEPAFPALVPFSRRLESLRFERGLTQRAVATRACISTNHYQDIAAARANPTLVVLLNLAHALEVSPSDLFESPLQRSSTHREVSLADVSELAALLEQLRQIVKRFSATRFVETYSPAESSDGGTVGNGGTLIEVHAHGSSRRKMGTCAANH
jgi:transcriptional regulator with XRE-family HTH domain